MNSGDGTVMKQGKIGGSPTVVATGQGQGQNLKVDATSLYWVSPNFGTVMKIVKN